MKRITFYFFILATLAIAGFKTASNRTEEITSGILTLTWDDQMWLHVNSYYASGITSGFVPADWITDRYGDFRDFKLKSSARHSFEDSIGKGTELTLTGKIDARGHSLTKILTAKAYEAFPDWIVYKVQYINTGDKALNLLSWTNAHLVLNRHPEDTLFWAFQGSSTYAREDWIRPVQAGYYNENYMGMNQTDYGGGIPVSAVWCHDGGLAIGHLEPVPKLVRLPLLADETGTKAETQMTYRFLEPLTFEPEDTLTTFETFISAFTGDCYSPLQRFSQLMQRKGMKMPEAEPAAFEPVWCAWGYGRHFTLDEVIGTLPKVKELGYKWAVLDDGYQITEGDWWVNRSKFPQGEKQMINLVKTIHSHGLKAKLWWAPLAVDLRSNLFAQKPGILLRRDDESPQYITWWDAFLMSPIAKETYRHTDEVLEMFLRRWDFDGLKMDGQHMNACSPDYFHDAEDPLHSVEAMPEFYKYVYQKARSIKPDAVIENCPCGCVMSFYHLPYINQTVSSDPESSYQIRSKGKVYKALVPKTAYYGDHVELSDGGKDFASSFGVGAVPGSKFTWPKDNPQSEESFVLTPEWEKEMKHWLSLYDRLMLSKGKYRGELYDIGFDKPETHVIEKDGKMYYAFYAGQFDGEVELRGLSDGVRYKVTDYYLDKDLGIISGGYRPKLRVRFKQFLLLEAAPVK